MIEALRANCLVVEKVVTKFSRLATNAQYFEINPLLGPLKDVHYHLHGGNLYFAGDGAAVTRVLLGRGFKVSGLQTAELTLFTSLELLRPILYRSLKYFFQRHGLWNPPRREEAYVVQPSEFNGTELVHVVENNMGERLIIYEGFKYTFDFLEGGSVLSLLPKVKPILPVRRNLSPEEITSGSQADIAFPSPQLIRKKGFYSSFRKIALKKSWEKEAVLMSIIGLLSDGQGQLVVPVGDDPDGLMLSTELLKIERDDADFYGK